MVQYHSSEPDLSRVFNALGDPTRMAMFQQIRQGEVTTGDLAKPLEITLTATLKHLKILEEAGLAESFKVGRERRCRIRLEPLNEIERWVEETRRAWNFRLDNLERFLNETES